MLEELKSIPNNTLPNGFSLDEYGQIICPTMEPTAANQRILNKMTEFHRLMTHYFVETAKEFQNVHQRLTGTIKPITDWSRAICDQITVYNRNINGPLLASSIKPEAITLCILRQLYTMWALPDPEIMKQYRKSVESFVNYPDP